MMSQRKMKVTQILKLFKTKKSIWRYGGNFSLVFESKLSLFLKSDIESIKKKEIKVC